MHTALEDSGRPRRRCWTGPLVTLTLLAALTPEAVHAQGAPLDSVTLSWTAPGDDGDVGRAMGYEVRWSLLPITDANWEAAIVVSAAPDPLPAGAHHSMVVGGLIPGTTYYFAIKAVDDAGNWSGLSNVLRWDGIPETTEVPGGHVAEPTAWTIEPGYPNPSHSGDFVTVPLFVSGTARDGVVDILNSAGERMRRLELNAMSSGPAVVRWDGRNEAERPVAPGVYTAWLIAGPTRASVKLMRVP
jgi:hypothetical protein